MIKFKYIIFFIFFSIFFSCEMEILVPQIPTDKIDKIIKGAKDLSDSQNNLIDGLYLSSDGKKDFGDTAVVKWSGNSLSFSYKKKNKLIFLIKRWRRTTQTIKIAGYWRYSLSSDLGFISLSINEMIQKQF